MRHLSMGFLRDVIFSLHWRYALFFFATVTFGLLSMLPPQLFRFFTHRAQTLSQMSARDFLVELGIFGVLVAVVMGVTSLGTTLCQEWLRLLLEADLRRRVLRCLHGVSLNVLDGVQRGDWLTRMTGDLGRTEQFLTESLPRQIRSLAVLLGAGILFASYSGRIALVPLGTALVLALVNFGVQQRLAPVLKELRELHGNIFQALIESLEGVRTIRSHSVEPYIQRQFESKLQLITTKSLGAVRILGLLLASNEFISQLMVTGCLTMVAWAMAAGTMSLNDVLIYPFFIGMFYGSAQSLAGGAYDWNRYFTEGGRLAQMLYGKYLPEKDYLRSLKISDSLDFRQSKSLVLNNVAIGHNSKALAGPFDFRLDRGRLCCITGPSGCGKSTLLEVLAGLRPAIEGEASLLDAGSVPLWKSDARKEMKLPQGLCAYVEQRPYIFEGSIRENLTFGNSGLGSEVVLWECLQSAGLFEFVKSVGGMDYVLTDRGQNLSEGERYRLAICRALLLKRPFLLLDEPFASLDEASVEIIIETLEAEKKSSGIVIVTHYLPANLLLDELRQFDDFGVANFPRVKEPVIGVTAPKTIGILAPSARVFREPAEGEPSEGIPLADEIPGFNQITKERRLI